MMRFVLRKFLQSVDDCLPCIVIAADANREYVTVRPQIRMVGTDNTLTSRAQVARVPVFTLGAGGFVMSWPIKPNDLGWIKASDRDISLYLQANKEAAPNSQRIHSFSDGVFFPDAARQFALADEDADNAVWQALDGSVKIAMGPAGVKITATLVHMTGDLMVDGAITSTGNMTGGGKSLDTHIHSGVQTGSGDTGPPV